MQTIQMSAAKYSEMTHGSLAGSLHPALRDVLRARKPTTLLDFGCGDGRFLASLDFVPERYGYDPDPAMRSIASRKLQGAAKALYGSQTDIPVNFFDATTCSLVLMMIADSNKYQETVQHLCNSVRPKGIVVIAVTHPCFRDKIFSDFETEYAMSTPYGYFSEGQPFLVRLLDRPHERLIEFHDYHWSLAHIIQTIIRAGLTLTGIIEVPDWDSSERSNKNVPPYLILTGERLSG